MSGNGNQKVIYTYTKWKRTDSLYLHRMIVEVCHNNFILVVYSHEMWTSLSQKERNKR